jgi:hypothetical protein
VVRFRIRPSVKPVEELEIRDRRKFSKVIYFDGGKINPITKLSISLSLDFFDTGNNETRVWLKCPCSIFFAGRLQA